MSTALKQAESVLSPSHPADSHRALACVSCQQRKIRCDRRFPCSNCNKSKVRCVPALPTRQRKQRFPERELLDRLRRYEALLRQHNVKFEPLHKDAGVSRTEAPDVQRNRAQISPSPVA